MLKLKATVGLAGMKPELVPAMIVANEVFAELGYYCMVTAVTDSAHVGASLHYVGYAMDLRTKHVPVEKQEAVRAEIAARLSPQYDVVLEQDHIHIEFQPKVNL